VITAPSCSLKEKGQITAILRLVPTYRLLILLAIIFVPATLLMVAVDSATVPTVAVAVAVTFTVATDAYRSRRRLKEVRVSLPELVRFSQGREAHIELQIGNREMTAGRLRLGLAFPE
jgi:Flp pilus assembly protein TadB